MPALSVPPAVRTVPSASKEAVWWVLGLAMGLPASLQLMATGSKRWAVALAKVSAEPPATSTVPSLSRVAVWQDRALAWPPLAEPQVRLPGSNRSGQPMDPVKFRPPPTRTPPSARAVAAGSVLGSRSGPWRLQESPLPGPAPGSYSSELPSTASPDSPPMMRTLPPPSSAAP